MSQVVPPPPAVPHVKLLPCPAAASRARRFCSITEDTRGKVAAGVANAGAGAGAGVLLECCVTVLTERYPNSSMSEFVMSWEAHYHRQCNRSPTTFSSSDRERR